MVSIRDHEQEIYDLIRSTPSVRWGVNNVSLELRMQLNKVIEAYGNLTKMGLLTRHEADEDRSYPYYTPNEDLVEHYLEFREGSINMYEKELLRHLKALKRKKIFFNIKRIKRKRGTEKSYKRSKDAKANFESFKGNLRRIIFVTSTLPFAQVLGIIPKKPKYDKMIMELQRKALSTAKKHIDQLCRDHKDHADIIQDDLKWSIPVFDEIQRMPNILKIKK